MAFVSPCEARWKILSSLNNNKSPGCKSNVFACFLTVSKNKSMSSCLLAITICGELSILRGSIVVIGGLLQSKKVKSRAGVPILGRIPILNWLFAQTREEVKKNKTTPDHICKHQRRTSAKTSSPHHTKRISLPHYLYLLPTRTPRKRKRS